MILERLERINQSIENGADLDDVETALNRLRLDIEIYCQRNGVVLVTC